MTRIHEPINISLASGEKLRGDLHYTQSTGDSAVVFVHGFASQRKGEKSLALEAECAKLGWTFAAIDCRGHGESDGAMQDLRASRLLEDLKALRHWLAGRGIRRLFLVGSSMGGFASAWFTLACEEVVACVFIAPAFRFLESRWMSLTEPQREQWRTAGVIRYKNEWIDVEVGYGLMEERHRYPFDELCRRWTKPAMIFHSSADETVPARDSIEFQQRVGCKKLELRIFKSSDHRLAEFKEEMAAETCRFFGEQKFD